MAGDRSPPLPVAVDSLIVDDLRETDLPSLGWSGNPAHLRSVSEKLEAVGRGQLEYLAIRTPEGIPVAKGAIEYGTREAAGEITQLAVRGDLQGLGIGSLLVGAAEDRIRRRGCRWAVMGVEVGNERVADLYERLGYRFYSEERAAWEIEDDSGAVTTHHAKVKLMRKEVQ